MNHSIPWTSYPMRRAIIFLFLGSVMVLSQKSFTQQDTVRLKYEDFEVATRFTGKPKPVEFSSNPNARRYRTALRNQAARGPNFAGHYTIVIWGVGTSTQAFAIVDAETGHAYFPKELPFVSWAGWYEKDYGLKFVLDSKLLIVYGHRLELDPKGIFYYLWEDNHLRLSKSIVIDSRK